MRILLSLALLIAPALAADANLVRLLPAGPRVVAGVSVSQSLNSPLGRFILSQMREDEDGLRKLTEATGFDFRRDLQEVVVANYGAAGTKDQTLVVARGSFDVARIRAAFVEHGGQTLTIEGVEMLQEPKKGGGAFAFVNGAMAVAGDAEMVRSALVRRTGQAANPEMARRIAEMSARFDAWMFTTEPVSSLREMPETAASGKKGPVNPAMLRGIVSASGGMKFGNTVEISGEAVARSEKDATALHDVLKFVTGMVTLNREEKGNEELARLVETLQVGSKGNTVSFSLSLPELELEKMIGQKRSGGGKI